VFNGAEGAEYEDISSPVLSIDGKQYGYVAKQSGKAFAVINGVAGAVFDEVSAIKFNPKGRGVAYRSKVGNQFVVVFDDQRDLNSTLWAEFSSAPRVSKSDTEPDLAANSGGKFSILSEEVADLNLII
jgi:hypothetical protein